MNMSDRLGKLATFYHREARKCSRAHAYFSASVMQVAALEAALQSMCFVFPADIKKTNVYRRKRFQKKRSKALEFNLYQLIAIAEELSWFPAKRISWGGKRATLGGFAHEIRKLRNFVHSGAWAREQQDTTKFSKRVYDVVFEVYDVAISWLLHRVHEIYVSVWSARRVKARRPTLTHHQQNEAIKRPNKGEEALAEIGRSYNVSGWTIGRLG